MSDERGQILVVDDEIDVCSQIAEELEDQGFDVTMASNYESARSQLGSTTFNAAILDIMGVRGQELLQEFGEKLPCIMLTANALTKKELKKSLQNHAALFLPKEELGQVGEHLNAVLNAWADAHTQEHNPRPGLWKRLFKRVSFIPFFGDSWWTDDEDFFKGIDLTSDDLDMDQLFGGRW